MSVQGILVSVYRNANLGDSTANGLSSKQTSLIMVAQDGGNFGCPHTTEEDYLVLVKDMCMGKPRLRAIPKSVLDAGNHNYMFGGNFVYSSDSRFPSDAPIRIHDRVENYGR